MERVITIETISDIESAAKKFLTEIGSNNIIALYGDMGAGKTTFTKGMCKVLNVTDIVNSPTFTIVNEYRTPEGRAIYHFDFYRIERLSEAFDIGFEEFMDSGELSIIEWPEKIEQILPEETLRVRIEVLDDGCRRLVF